MNPVHLSNRFRAAVEAFQKRQYTEAIRLCREIVALDPGDVDALHMQGLAHSELACHEEAVRCLRQTINLQPDNPVLWTNLGEVRRKAGEFEEAVVCHQRAIAIRPDFPEAHFNLSVAAKALDDVSLAMTAAREAVRLRPAYAKAQYHLGNVLRDDGRVFPAVKAFEAALQLKPGWAEAQLNLAVTLLEIGEPARALPLLEGLRGRDVALPELHRTIGHAYSALGRVQDAAHAYAEAGRAAGTETPMQRLFRETLAEVILPNPASIDHYRQQVDGALKRFAESPCTIDIAKLATEGAVPSMMLAYYGLDVRPVLERYAAALGKFLPTLLPPTPTGQRPKLGIVVTQGHEGVFARCWGGIAERLSRALFEVRIICSRGGANVLQTMLQLDDREYFRIPSRIDEAATTLRNEGFDWLHYWEIGTDAMNYYLPFLRPARGQSATWGWPVTSGNPRVDAYFTSKCLEPADAASHYSERLVLLTHLPTCYVRPPAPPDLGKSHFGLDAHDNVYLCTQNLRKYHPDFDLVLAGILKNDTNARILLIADSQPSITQLLLDRFRRSVPEVAARIRVMPRMEREEYLALLELSDVALDTLHYGAGANTVYDAVSVGTPLVTVEGDFHRGRWAAAVHRRLTIPELIATDQLDYVNKAVGIANDPAWRTSLSDRCLAEAPKIFEDMQTVREHEQAFLDVIGQTGA